jgi:hypothetical protein
MKNLSSVLTILSGSLEEEETDEEATDDRCESAIESGCLVWMEFYQYQDSVRGCRAESCLYSRHIHLEYGESEKAEWEVRVRNNLGRCYVSYPRLD